MRHLMTTRTRAIAVGMALLTAAAVGPGARAAVAPEDAGQGVALAQTVKFDPKAGGLSLGITFGQAIAAHQNLVSQATSQAINFGVIGSTLASEGCDGSAPSYPADQQPQPLRVDSRQPGADKGKTETEDGGMFTKTVRADGTPYGEAITTTAPFTIPGVLSVGGGTARTHSGLVKGVREAQATVDIDGLDLAGGVKLSALRWEATYRTNGTKQVVGKFTIGSASIGGQTIPATDPTAALMAINGALAPLGLKIVPPAAHEAGGVLFVDPIGIAVVPSAQRDALAGQVLGAAQPVRQSLFDALLAQSCKNATYITIFDLVVGSVTGAGEFALALGGAQASSGAIPKNQFSLLNGDYELGGGNVPSGPVDDTRAASLDSTSTFTPVADAIGSGPGVTPVAAGDQVAIPVPGTGHRGNRGGPLAAVGLVTLGLLALAAEGDRRKMRRAQREIAALD